MTARRLLQYAAIGGGLVLVMGVAVAAFASLKVPFSPPTAQASSGPCSPQPCANVRGFIVWITDVKTENGLVSMKLTFKNSSNATHADPADITLVASDNSGSAPVYDAPGCTRWPRTEFNHGATFGPVPECFRIAGATRPVGLRWTPDFGPFCCETMIALD